MTDRNEQRMIQFTDIRSVVMEGAPDAHNVYLVAGEQRFVVCPGRCETKQEAEWMRGQLCRALENIVEQTSMDKP